MAVESPVSGSHDDETVRVAGLGKGAVGPRVPRAAPVEVDVRRHEAPHEDVARWTDRPRGPGRSKYPVSAAARLGRRGVGAARQEGRAGRRIEEGRPLTGAFGLDAGAFEEQMLVEDLDHRFELTSQDELPALAHDLRLHLDQRAESVEEREDGSQRAGHRQDGFGDAAGVAKADHVAVLETRGKRLHRAEPRILRRLRHETR